MTKPIVFYSLFLVLSMSLLTGCTKEEISPTPGEVAANEIKAVIEKNNIKRVYPLKYNEQIPNQFPVDYGTQWSFSNGFIHINYVTLIQDYNLNYLVGYGIHNVQLSNGNSDKALLLFIE